jgi:hypothetical protein
MHDPSELIQLISSSSKNIILWTHFYDKKIIGSNTVLARKFSASLKKSHNGFEHTLHKYVYGEALAWPGFCGGYQQFSYWMSREDILSCLRFFGFDDLRIGFEEPGHPNGPSFCVVGLRCSGQAAC